MGLFRRKNTHATITSVATNESGKWVVTTTGTLTGDYTAELAITLCNAVKVAHEHKAEMGDVNHEQQ